MLKASWISRDISKVLGRIFKIIPLHPNIITVSSVFFAIGGFYAYDYSGWLSFGLFLFALFIDAVDGAVARAKNMESRKGAFIDGVSDRVVEFFMILTLMYKADIPTLLLDKQLLLLGVLFFGTCMTSFVKAYAEHMQVMKHPMAVKMPGLLERAERVVLLAVVFILAVAGSTYSAPVLLFTAALSLATFLERVARTLVSKE